MATHKYKNVGYAAHAHISNDCTCMYKKCLCVYETHRNLALFSFACRYSYITEYICVVHLLSGAVIIYSGIDDKTL